MKGDKATYQPPILPPYLTSKLKIGTCKGPIGYKVNQTTIHRNDIPDDKKARVEEVNNWRESKVLQKNQSWNQSTQELTLVKSRSMENHVQDRANAYAYNFRAESLDPNRIEESIDKPTKFHISRTSASTAKLYQTKQLNDTIQQGHLRRTEELPINLNLADKEGWNSMTSYSNKDHERNLIAMTKKSKEFTGTVSKKVSIVDYIGPMETEKIYQKSLRKSKSEGTFMPLSKTLTSVEEKSPAKNRLAVEKTRGYTTSQHSGVWELNKIDKK